MDITWNKEQDIQIVKIALSAKKEKRDYLLEFNNLSRKWNVEKFNIVSRWFYLANCNNSNEFPLQITPKEFCKKQRNHAEQRKDESELTKEYIRSDNFKSDPWREWEDKLLIEVITETQKNQKTKADGFKIAIDKLSKSGSTRTINACERRYGRLTNSRINWSDSDDKFLVESIIDAVLNGEDLNERYKEIEEVLQVEWNKCRTQFNNLKNTNPHIKKRYDDAVSKAAEKGLPLPRARKSKKAKELGTYDEEVVENGAEKQENIFLGKMINILQEDLSKTKKQLRIFNSELDNVHSQIQQLHIIINNQAETISQLKNKLNGGV